MGASKRLYTLKTKPITKRINMPCNADYMNPTNQESYSKRTCQLLVYALTVVGSPVPDWVKKAADNYYGDVARVHEAADLLCTLCRGMSEEQQTVIIYDGRNAEARALADWWEEHKEADAARFKKEEEATKKEQLRKQALSKLTPEEREALRLNQH